MVPTRALVQIDPLTREIAPQVLGLKRLALFFDEIHFRVTRFWRLKDEVAADPRKYRRVSEGHVLPAREFRPFVAGYNPLSEVSPDAELKTDTWDPELRDTVEALKDAGIAKAVDEETVRQADPTNRMAHLRSLFANADFNDEEFARLSGDERSFSFTFGRLGLGPAIEGGETSELLYIHFPPTVLDSITLTETLFLAHVTGSNSVFLRPQFGRELDLRYRKFREGIGILKHEAPEIYASLRLNAHFGEVSFNIANAIVSSSLLHSRSLDELLRFRAEMNDARQRFITTDLHDIDAMVTENAWSPAAKEEMNRYIQSKLAADIVAYNDKTKEMWEKLFGNAAVRLAKVGTSAVLGGAASQTAGGLLGSVIPNATEMSLLCIAVLASLGRQSTGFYRELEEVRRESRKAKRSSIAYVALLSKLQ